MCNKFFILIVLLSICQNLISMEKQTSQQDSIKLDFSQAQELINQLLKNNLEAIDYILKLTDQELSFLRKIINNRLNEAGETALIRALSQKNNSSIILILLQTLKCDINKANNNGQTPLHFAAIHQDNEIINLLIKEGADVQAVDNNGLSPLHYAAQNNSNAVQLLINRGAQINLESNIGLTPLHLAAIEKPESVREILKLNNQSVSSNVDADAPNISSSQTNIVNVDAETVEGHTPLHLAASHNNFEAIIELLKHNANIDSTNKSGATPLHFAVESAVKHLESLKVLLENKADIAVKNKAGDNALHIAIKNKVNQALEILIQNKADIEAKNDEGLNALHLAVLHNASAIKILLDHGADINAFADNGYTPLHIAVLTELFDTMKILINNQADINIKATNHSGHTPLHLAIEQKSFPLILELLKNNSNLETKNNEGLNAFHLISKHRPDMIKFLFSPLVNDLKLANQPNIETKSSDGKTPLHFAARYSLTSVKELLRFNPNINAKDNEGFTALHIAAEYNPEVVKLLLDYGAEIDVKNNLGFTPLHISIQKLNLESARILLSKPQNSRECANINALTNENQTALHLAAIYNPGAILFLLGYKANLNALDTNGFTPLHLAAQHNLSSLALLLVNGANIRATTSNGRLALHVAAQYNPAAVEILLNPQVFRELFDNENINQLIKNFESIEFCESLIESVTNDEDDRRTPLHYASAHNAECLKILLKYHANIHARTKNNLSVFHIAARHNLESLKSLLQFFQGTILIKDQLGNTPLHYAVTNPASVQLLLSYYPICDLINGEGMTPLHFAAQTNFESFKILFDKSNILQKTNKGLTVLHLAAKSKVQIVRFLLEYFKKINDVSCIEAIDLDGFTPLHYAALANSDALGLLLEHKVNINAKTSKGQTALHLAVEKNNLASLKLLLQQSGISLSESDQLNNQPLHLAIGNFELAKLLLEHKALPEVFNQKGETPIFLACQNLKKPTKTVRLLLNAGAKPSQSLILLAIEKKDKDLLFALLEKADKDLKTFMSDNEYVKEINKIRFLFEKLKELLISKPNVDKLNFIKDKIKDLLQTMELFPSSIDDYDCNVLKTANENFVQIYKPNPSIINLINEFKNMVDLNTRDLDGNALIDYAVEYYLKFQNKDLIETLLLAGAEVNNKTIKLLKLKESQDALNPKYKKIIDYLVNFKDQDENLAELTPAYLGLELIARLINKKQS